MLRGLVDTTLANRKLFVHGATSSPSRPCTSRDTTATSEQQFRRILANGAIPARDRVRLSCALGALLTAMSLSDLEDLGPATYGDLLREAITDLLEP